VRGFSCIRSSPHYRAEAFWSGLAAVGAKVSKHLPSRFLPGDVLCIWNRYGANEALADQAEHQGATVIVVENGYLGADAQGRQHYAMSVGQHNGAGWTPPGDDSRLGMLGATLRPWRERGEHILVRAQRGIGSRLMASPRHWGERTVEELRRRTKRPVVLRQHPAVKPDQAPLQEMLRGAHALVTWASSDAGKALVMGVPAFYAAPHLICEAACRRLGHDIEDPFLGDRVPALRRLSWGQWEVSEIAAGVPFRALLAGRKEMAA
jgi:hypothetical protein